MQSNGGKCAEYQELVRKLRCPNPQFLLAVFTIRSSAQQCLQDFLKLLVTNNLWEAKLPQLTHAVQIRNCKD